MNRDSVCKVTVFGWWSVLPTMYEIECRICERSIGSFSQHESAMAWAQAHATSSKHLRR